MAKKEEELQGEKMVTVLKPIQADGITDGGGWSEVELPESVAMEQLSLPKAERNAAWKHAKLKD
ncbi:MAG: hypothetical protein V4714_08220 [Bacteroidota bacterium]